MEHAMVRLVLQLSIIIITVKVFGFIFKRFLKQSGVMGELVAGMIIGPYALGGMRLPIELPFLGSRLFTLPQGEIPVSSELYGFAIVASIILLFLAGLETDLPTFLRFSLRGSLVGIGGVITSFCIGDLLAVLILPGVSSFFHPSALFLGTLSTATSVGITARILSEKRKMSSPEGVTILAGAVLDDVLGIILLAVVVGIVKIGDGGSGGIPWMKIGIIGLKAFGFWLGSTFLGIILMPRITRFLKKMHSHETLAGILVGFSFLLAGLSEMAGLAMIIGAYVLGLSLSQTDCAHELREYLQGLYQFLVPVFFCVMGMMVNFRAILKPHILMFGLIFSLGAVAGKIFGCGIPSLLTGFNLKGALRIGTGMLPRGEVTLIVAGIGLASGAIGSDLFGVAIITLFIASIFAPPLLVMSFKGGSGLKKPTSPENGRKEIEITLDFPTVQIADFMRHNLRNAFINEEFAVHRLDYEHNIYHVRKEDILITIRQNKSQLIVSTSPENEQLVRLIIVEEIITLKDLFHGIEKMKSLDELGSEIIGKTP